jgi:hypothetical protein
MLRYLTCGSVFIARMPVSIVGAIRTPTAAAASTPRASRHSLQSTRVESKSSVAPHRMHRTDARVCHECAERGVTSSCAGGFAAVTSSSSARDGWKATRRWIDRSAACIESTRHLVRTRRHDAHVRVALVVGVDRSLVAHRLRSCAVHATPLRPSSPLLQSTTCAAHLRQRDSIRTSIHSESFIGNRRARVCSR